jgi:hypothetical protein
MLAQNFAVRKLEKLLNRIEQDEGQGSAAEVVRILVVGVRVERLARGESTESHEISGPGRGPVRLSLKETIARIREFYGLEPQEPAANSERASDNAGTAGPKL